MVLEAGRDIPQDVARDCLGQFPVRRLDFDQPFDRNVRLDKAHPAADIHPDRIRNDDLFGSDDAPDRHPIAGMSIRHQYDPLMQKRQIRQILRLLQAILTYLFLILQPNLDWPLLFLGIEDGNHLMMPLSSMYTLP